MQSSKIPTVKDRDKFDISCIWDGGEREFELPQYYIHFEIVKFSQSNTESIVYLADLYNFHPLRCNLQDSHYEKQGWIWHFMHLGWGRERKFELPLYYIHLEIENSVDQIPNQ